MVINRKPFQGMWEPCVRAVALRGLGGGGRLPWPSCPQASAQFWWDLKAPSKAQPAPGVLAGRARSSDQRRPTAVGLGWHGSGGTNGHPQPREPPPPDTRELPEPRAIGVPWRLPPVGMVEHHLHLRPAPFPCLRSGGGAERSKLVSSHSLLSLVPSPPPGATQEPTHSHLVRTREVTSALMASEFPRVPGALCPGETDREGLRRYILDHEPHTP